MIRAALAAALLLIAGVAEAAGPSSGRWVISHQPQWCSLFRVVEGQQAPLFELRDVPAANDVRFAFPVPKARAGLSEDVQMQIPPSGETLKRRAHPTMIVRGGEAWPATLVGATQLDALRSASSIKVIGPRGVIADVPVPGMQAALDALRGCEDALLKDWGFDVAAYRALSTMPLPIDRGNWFNPDDYPVGALLELRTGAAVARVDIDSTGAVTGCAIVASSGNDLLDWQSCAKLPQRARFEPARDGGGKPVRSQAAVFLAFVLYKP
ncbi:MAG: hypothetical protein QOE79_2303 [Sphingomonadales bacterium]|jgi:TonB family protein|nr:hypothetical protein [Sphingomonadales bacterium]